MFVIITRIFDTEKAILSITCLILWLEFEFSCRCYVELSLEKISCRLLGFFACQTSTPQKKAQVLLRKCSSPYYTFFCQ